MKNIFYSFIFFVALILSQISPVLAKSPLAAGPMLGHTTADSTLIWIQTDKPAQIKIRYWPRDEALYHFQERKAQILSTHFLSTKVVLTNLKPDTVYVYEVFIDGERIDLAQSAEFQTLKVNNVPDFSFAIGSCMYLRDGFLDLMGAFYGSDYGVLKQIPLQKPDFMLWLGDNLYFRNDDFSSDERMNARYRQMRTYPDVQVLMASFPHYAIWDDHDYGPNNSDRLFQLKQVSFALFQNYWGNPSYGETGKPGVYTRFRWYDVEFFLLDDRFYRDSNDDPDENRVFLGKNQLKWLQDGLKASKATFKVVAAGNQLLNPQVHVEGFRHFPKEQKAFLNWLESTAIPGVIFLSGDRHYTELLKMERKKGYPLYEFTSSPMTSGVIPAFMMREATNPLRVKDTLVMEKNFGMIKVSGSPEQRKLTLQTINKNGDIRWEYVILAKDLY